MELPNNRRNSRIQKLKQLKLSRMDRLRRNPIPWLLILMITAGIFFVSTFPVLTDWQKARDENQALSIENPRLETELQQTQQKLEIKKKELEVNIKSGEDVESQIFPPEISPSSAIKTLEIYSLLLNYGPNGPVFDLNSVNFQRTNKNEEFPYATTSINMELTGDPTSIRNFFIFLEQGAMSPEHERYLESREEVSLDLQFIRQNKLPLARIKNIQYVPSTNNKSDRTNQELKSARVEIILYSQN
jgi:hypothetical protein